MSIYSKCTSWIICFYISSVLSFTPYIQDIRCMYASKNDHAVLKEKVNLWHRNATKTIFRFDFVIYNYLFNINILICYGFFSFQSLICKLLIDLLKHYVSLVIIKKIILEYIVKKCTVNRFIEFSYKKCSR